jgi:hypothetical protein
MPVCTGSILRWRHELRYFDTKKAGGRLKKGKPVIWENLVLIKAKSPEEAYRKALKHGRLSKEKVKIAGEDGYCRSRDLRIYGAELEWHDLRLGVSELGRMAKRKRQMQAFNVGPK